MSITSDAQRQADLDDEARRLGIPPWQLEMARAVGTDVLADIRRDNRRSVHEPSSPVRCPSDRPAPSTGGTGWVDGLPLKPPRDVGLIDRQIDVQDAIDLAQRTQTLDALKP